MTGHFTSAFSFLRFANLAAPLPPEKLRQISSLGESLPRHLSISGLQLREVPLSDLQSKEEVGEPYTEVGALSEEMKEARSVLCVVTEQEGSVSRQMVKFVASLNRESIVDVHGTLTVPSSPIKGASQQVEIQVNRLYCVSKALPTLPINLEDAARSEAEIDKALQVSPRLAPATVYEVDRLHHGGGPKFFHKVRLPPPPVNPSSVRIVFRLRRGPRSFGVHGAGAAAGAGGGGGGAGGGGGGRRCRRGERETL
ncbi:hypothetical protein NL676_012824 [Syzygium grande]|nr:hypothetical protein NL676_012824 [Syzygium grande]